MKNLIRFLVGVKKETKKIKWPEKKQLVMYSIATITFMIIVGAFFSILDAGLTFLKTIV